MRLCKKCQTIKNLIDFTPSKICKDGFSYVCLECRREQRLLWNQKNKEKKNLKQKEWAALNKDKVKAIQIKFYQKNPKYGKAYKLPPSRRCPAWADKEAIRKFYLNCPEGFHVDHVIPLRGKLVSGLHIISNLQYLPALENIKKGNKYAVHA